MEAYYKAQGMFHEVGAKEGQYTDVLTLDLGSIVPSLAGPARPQDRVLLKDMKQNFVEVLPKLKAAATAKPKAPSIPMAASGPDVGVTTANGTGQLHDGSVVIAAITSCTNTSNPSVMLAAGLLARNAVAKGLHRKPWVKTSLAPGSKVVPDYYAKAGLMEPLEALGFHIVGFGCTTCIGNSGPLAPAITDEINSNQLVVGAVLSGNRNFEGRVHPEVRANYLASPPLVVAYALTGRVDFDWDSEAIGQDPQGNDVFLKDIWPAAEEVKDVVAKSVTREQFMRIYDEVYAGDEHWQSLAVPTGNLYEWANDSTYIANPPYFEGMTRIPPAVHEIVNARVLALLGDSITTDHISPAGSIKADSPAGKYLMAHGVEPKRLQSIWCSPRQSRRHDAGHLCQRSTSQSTRANGRRRLHSLLADRRNDVDLRCVDEVSRSGNPVSRAGGQGVWLRFQS